MIAVSVRWKRVMATCLAAVVLVAVCLTVAYGRVVFAPSSRPPSSRDVSFERERELVMVHTISRHGERTPADTFPTDPHINHTFYPYGWGSLTNADATTNRTYYPYGQGSLTNAGRMQMYKLGLFLRSRYDRFLGDMYTEQATYAQSTGANRARMSCALILAGLWPPAGTPLDWNPALNWQPIPIVSQELDEDTLLLVRKRCPRYNEALNEVLNSSRLREDMGMGDNAQLMQELTKQSGMPILNYDDVQSLYNTLKAEEAMGIDIAAWAKQYYPELVPLTAASFVINSYTDEMIRLKGGLFLKKLISDWSAAVSEAQRPRIFVYTGHDSTVANLARALGVWEPQVPAYGITLLLELYRDVETHQYFLEVHLQNSTQIEPFHLTIPGCTQSCPIEKVTSLRGHLMPGDWQKECEAHDPSFEPPPPSGP